jgi:phosphatidylinositol alpha 1,6-mannosyltransferase
LLSFLPQSAQRKLGPAIRQASLLATLRFYKIARVLFGPNQELVAMLENGTGKPCYPMQRGVDALLFDPRKRDRTDTGLVLGYVGRLSTEKNVRQLAEIEHGLLASGFTNFRFLVVGQGAEEAWLKENLEKADFTGVLRGEDLARAYANMDLFVFPSLTDTYGNVVLEALASGVPAIVSDSGGPQFIVEPDKTGFIARSVPEFVSCIQTVAGKPGLLPAMRVAAREQAENYSWDRVFESVYATYERELRSGSVKSRVGIGQSSKVAASHIG